MVLNNKKPYKEAFFNTLNMIKKAYIIAGFLLLSGFAYCQKPLKDKAKIVAIEVVKDSIKIAKDTVAVDTITVWKTYKETARASYYADKFNGRRMANGKKFDMTKLTAAHKKLPFGTMLKITNVANGKSVIIEITDRGPFVKSREIDLSRQAFKEIADDLKSGLMTVKIEITDCLKVP